METTNHLSQVTVNSSIDSSILSNHVFKTTSMPHQSLKLSPGVREYHLPCIEKFAWSARDSGGYSSSQPSQQSSNVEVPIAPAHFPYQEPHQAPIFLFRNMQHVVRDAHRPYSMFAACMNVAQITEWQMTYPCCIATSVLKMPSESTSTKLWEQ